MLDPIVSAEVQPAPAAIRRLLARQYVNTVEMMFGKEAAKAASPPPDQALNGYQAIAASQLALNDDLVAQYEASARAVAAAVANDPEVVSALAACDPSADGERVCFEAVVRRLGRLAFRRPLEDEEVEAYLEVADTGLDTLESYAAGVEFLIVALLQSPSFLFQVEIGTPLEGGGGVRKLDGYEMAARMSLFLIDQGPDDELLDAAERGELEDEAGVREHARRLLRSHRAREASAAFFTEYFVLADLELMPKDPVLFPDYSQQVARSMQRETLELVEEVIWRRNAPVTELLTADYSFIDEHLATLYQVPAPDAPFSPVSFPAAQNRRGLLSHASFLAGQSHADSTSVTHRGMYVLERFLCTSMPPPPEGVVTELPPSSTAPTMRERVAVHLDNETCAGCHTLVDGMGLAMENFDAVGRFREKENGELIDASGQSGFLGEFVGVAELSEKLAASERATDCMVRNLYRHATGHVETKAELAALGDIHTRFRASGLRWRELLVEMAASPLVRAVGPMEKAEP